MTFNIEPFSNQAFQLGEGPHWHNEKLYFVDILGGLAATIDVNGKYELLHRENDYITAVLPVEGDDQRLVLSTKSDLYLLNVKTGHKVLVDAIKTEAARFNDGKCDSKHKLWIGTMGLESEPGKLAPERGSLYSLNSNGNLEAKLTKVSLSNGMCWSLDDKQMFYIDSVKRCIYVFDYDIDNGSISNQKTFVDLNTSDEYHEAELPDGMTIDVNGNLWVALFRGSRIVNIDTKTGKVIRSIQMPTTMVTSVCFGGPNLDEMYVTSAKTLLDEERKAKEPYAGFVFKVTSTDPSFKGHKYNYNIKIQN